MGGTPYRRGNLREALLERAMVVVSDRGAGALSFRELARDVGVSHAAPARHFADRQQLLEALALAGFATLSAEIAAAISSTDDLQEQARRAAQAYGAFATGKANLMSIMFAHEDGSAGEAIRQGATTAFEPMLGLFQRAERAALVPAGGAETAATLFLAALQGVTALANCGIVPPEAVPGLIDDAVPRAFGPTAV